MEKLEKRKIKIKVSEDKYIEQELWELEDIANKINEIIELLNEITNK